MDATRPVSTDLSQYLGMLRRHWWILVLAVGLGAGAAVAITETQPKVYRSATSVLVSPAGTDTNASGGRTKGDINLDTEAQLVRSTAVANGAKQLLRSPAASDELAKAVTVEVPANTTVLVIAYTGDSPQAAQSSSHAFAEAYLRNRETSARARLDRDAAALQAKIKQLNAILTNINTQIARTNGIFVDFQ